MPQPRRRRRQSREHSSRTFAEKFRRGHQGRRTKPLLAIMILLVVAIIGGIVWYRNDPFDLTRLRGSVGHIAHRVDQIQMSRTVAEAKPTDPPTGSRQIQGATPTARFALSAPLHQSTPQVSNVSTVAELERQVHAGINAERTRNGTSELRWEEELAAVARAHSDDMTLRGYFSHDTPEGLGPWDRIGRSGYNCRRAGGYRFAENIAVETTLGNTGRTAAAAVSGWMNSPGHRTNLLGRQFVSIFAVIRPAFSRTLVHSGSAVI